MKKKLLLLALCSMLLTNMTCKKSYIEKNELPPITQIGANTFGCYVNGEIFLPRGNGMNIIITATKSDNRFFIKISDSFNIARMIVIVLEQGVERCIKLSIGGECSTENCTNTNNDITNLKMDETNKIISGEFNAILPATATCPEVKITEGRFDLKYTEN
jgi:hypothetical protein